LEGSHASPVCLSVKGWHADEDKYGALVEWHWQGKRNQTSRRRTFLRVTSSTTNFIWTEMGSKPDLRGERFATKRLRQDATLEHPN
jgi:hypothetical protein